MAGIGKTRLAVRFSIYQLVAGGAWADLWTFTTEDKIALPVLAERWNVFRRWFERAGWRCVRVFEPHPGGHGWHVHFVTAERLDVDVVRPKAEAAGFGRIHVKRLPGEKAAYLTKYVGKRFADGSRPRGARMWACVGFKGFSAKDVEIPKTKKYWGHWINDHWELKEWPPHLDEMRLVVGPDGKTRLERIWVFPPGSPGLDAEIRWDPLGCWSEEKLLRWGFKKMPPGVLASSLTPKTELRGAIVSLGERLRVAISRFQSQCNLNRY